MSLAQAYALARERMARTAAALAGTRARELESRLERQVARMTQYYQDLRAGAAGRRARAVARDAARDAAVDADPPPAGGSSTEAIDREEPRARALGDTPCGGGQHSQGTILGSLLLKGSLSALLRGHFS